MKRKILLDTNFLLIPAQFNVDIFSEIDRLMLENYHLFVLDKTIAELKKITADRKQSLKHRNAAKLALQLIKAKQVKIIETAEDLPVDDLIARMQKDYIVATQDIALKRRLNTKIITLRAKKKLIVV